MIDFLKDNFAKDLEVLIDERKERTYKKLLREDPSFKNIDDRLFEAQKKLIEEVSTETFEEFEKANVLRSSKFKEELYLQGLRDGLVVAELLKGDKPLGSMIMRKGLDGDQVQDKEEGQGQEG